MRAIYYKDLESLEKSCELVDEKFHHLAKVLRVQVNDEVLFLDGLGRRRKSVIKEIQKKKIICDFIEEIKFEPKLDLYKVAIGKTKREALELSLKQLVEIGVSDIYIVESEFSQRYPLKIERLNKLIESALEQSNGSYLPTISEIRFDELKNIEYKSLVYFSSISTQETKIELSDKSNLIVIGPEGGFSRTEELEISKFSNAHILNLKTNIMRAPTAVSFCLGYCMFLENN